MTPEKALRWRTAHPIDGGRIVLTEAWDRYHPDCPFIDNPWSSFREEGDTIVHQRVLTECEFARVNLPLKARVTCEQEAPT